MALKKYLGKSSLLNTNKKEIISMEKKCSQEEFNIIIGQSRFSDTGILVLRLFFLEGHRQTDIQAKTGLRRQAVGRLVKKFNERLSELRQKDTKEKLTATLVLPVNTDADMEKLAARLNLQTFKEKH